MKNINKELSCHAKAKSKGVNTRREADYIGSLRQYRKELGIIIKEATGHKEEPRHSVASPRIDDPRNNGDVASDPFSEKNIMKQVKQMEGIAERQRPYSPFKSLSSLLDCYISGVKRDCWIDGIPGTSDRMEGKLANVDSKVFTFVSKDEEVKYTYLVRDFVFSYSFTCGMWFVSMKPNKYKAMCSGKK